MGQAQKSYLPSINMIAPSLEIIPYEKVRHVNTGASTQRVPALHTFMCLLNAKILYGH